MFEELINKTVEEAKEIILSKDIGKECRVVERNGHCYSFGCDLRTDRINFIVEGELIIQAYIG